MIVKAVQMSTGTERNHPKGTDYRLTAENCQKLNRLCNILYAEENLTLTECLNRLVEHNRIANDAMHKYSVKRAL